VVKAPAISPGETLKALQPVVDAIAAAGVAPDQIEAVAAPSLVGYFVPGGGGGMIEVTIEQPTQEGVAAIVEAAAAAATGPLFLQQVGVQYDVADCARLVQEARQSAVDQAKAEAAALAEALGGTLGGVLQVTAFAVSGLPAGTESQGCYPAPPFDYLVAGAPFTIPLFDPSAPAVAATAIQLTVTFEFVPAQP
jgi:hypothetical protein